MTRDERKAFNEKLIDDAVNDIKQTSVIFSQMNRIEEVTIKMHLTMLLTRFVASMGPDA